MCWHRSCSPVKPLLAACRAAEDDVAVEIGSTTSLEECVGQEIDEQDDEVQNFVGGAFGFKAFGAAFGTARSGRFVGSPPKRGMPGIGCQGGGGSINSKLDAD